MKIQLVSIVFVVVATTLLALVHRYIWRRTVADTSLDGPARRIASGVLVVLALLVPAAMILPRLVGRGSLSVLPTVAFGWLGALFYLTMLLFAWDLAKLGRRFVLRIRRGRGAPHPDGPHSLADAEVVGLAPEPALPDGAQVAGSPVEAAEATPQTPLMALLSSPLLAPLPPSPSPAHRDAEPPSPSRRAFIARAAAGGALVGTSGLVTLGVRNALGDIDRPLVEVRLPRLPPQLSGLRIVQISDVHIGPILDRRFIERVVDEVNALRPDVVAITGDLVDAPVSLIGADLAPLARLRPRWGTWFVTGNHEYYAGIDGWSEHLATLGVRTLLNERVTIGDAVTLDLAGTPDDHGGRFLPDHAPDLPRALAGRDPDRPLVLLAHRPNGIVGAADAGVGLQLSGHTHGGQLWPFGAAVAMTHPYVAGLHQHTQDTWIYVSRGTGFWGPPMRVGAPAEITTVVLTA